MNKTKLILAGVLTAMLAACGGNDKPAPNADAPAAAPEAAAPAAAPAPAVANAAGESTFKKVCSMCHASGAAGSPKPGDKAAWAPRIAQGKDVLYKHALEGFTGANGMMPARGGNPSLSDDDVKAAVDYMVSQSQ